jgi:D-sedoheptulose 7-phosphate isomerase
LNAAGTITAISLWRKMKKKRTCVDRVTRGIVESARTIASLAPMANEIAAISQAIIGALKRGKKILTAGNGGSAAEALHMAEEFTGRFKSNRRSLPAVSLVADCTVLTCIANDFGYDSIFSRQIEGLGNRGDVLVLFSTSGKSPNVIKALKAAKSKGMVTVSFLGGRGGLLAGRSDYEIIVEGVTERIQEAHQVLVHLILDDVEEAYKEKKTC